MPVTLDRTWLNAQVDDSGSGTDGSILDKADFTAIYDAIDVALAAVGGGLSAGSNYINDTSNANMTIGLTINQGTNDDEILALKSSDIAHGITTLAETDTYATLKKAGATQGGIHLRGLSTTYQGMVLEGDTGLVDTTRNTVSLGAVLLKGALKSGTSVTTLGTNANVLVVQDDTTTRFILDSDGDSHQDVGTAWTNFDAHDDVAILNVLAAYVTRPDDPLKAAFGAWLLQSRDILERLRLVTFNDDGHHFVNMSRLTMLLVGAMRQVGHRLERLEQRCRALEARHG